MPNHEHLNALLIEEQYPEEILRALNYAAEKHEKSIRKLSGNPYIEHPFEVFELVRDAGGSMAEQIGAILHDVLEKSDTTYEDLVDKFGKEVADIVKGVSKADSDDKTVDGWYRANRAYLAHLSTDAPEGSVVVALADKINNLDDIIKKHAKLGESMWESFKTGAEAQLWWNSEVREVAIQRAADSPVVKQLAEKLDSLIITFRTEVMGRTAGTLMTLEHNKLSQTEQ